VWLLRDPRRTAEDTVLAALRRVPPTQLVSLVLSASSSRGRPSVLELLEIHARAAHCRISLAETRGIAVRWVDGIVSGTVEDVAAFLTAIAPLLARCHGRAELAAA
jgi:hypothetical protein